MTLPKITIIIATFNAEKTLEKCLKSIESQTYPTTELIVIDGNSTDGTVKILKSHSSRISYWISEPDEGIYDAWNKAIRHATGEWLLFLGADDELWAPDTLNQAASHLQTALHQYRIVYGKIAITLPSGEILNFDGIPWEKAARRPEMQIPHQGTFHHASLFKEHGLFNPSFRICGDYEFLLRELKNRPAYFMQDVVVSKMAFGGLSGKPENTLWVIEELNRARQLNGVKTSLIWLASRKLRIHARLKIEKIFGKAVSDAAADWYRWLAGKPRVWDKLRNPAKNK